ncbi:MarR family winged helix-turn-helix transcriptional regulator [Amycolatopsis eburnea]|uniref:MarR family transcriptional regulator n=1 Tax=Amycolatopsis eburnea TaxID=2267691 RepID=A0A3R9E1Y5_9PSEU|nr:MarR family transcriptional regulator [Amycolatopsis eburnea]RSD14779.1 MarR family transcriptional regulator [Amycolatopsis eburnea]
MTLDEETIAGLEREFAVFVRQDRAASGQLGREVHPDLKVAAYRLLAHLAERGPRRPTELACHVGVTAPTVSRQLQHLEELGLISRVQTLDDGRAYLVRLTEAGHRRVEEVRVARSRRLDKLLGSWAEEEIRTFAELLARFNGSAAAPPPRQCGGEG